MILLSIWTITLYGFLVGMIGTGLGGLISLFIRNTNRTLSFLLGITGGFMMFIVTFHLLPESFMMGGVFNVIIGVLLGILLIVLVENYVEGVMKNPIMKGSLILGISIAVHNFPEGLALGSSFLTNSNLGPVLALAMMLHNIPEGISMAIPLKVNKISPWRIILYTTLTGIPTGIGAFFGGYMGMISPTFISLCLSFAGGTMLYIICDEIIPEARNLHKGRSSSIGVVLGFILGLIIYF